MAGTKIKMPSKAMVNLYDMSQEGLEDGDKDFVDNFANVFEISNEQKPLPGGPGGGTVHLSQKNTGNNKYKYVVSAENEHAGKNIRKSTERISSPENGESPYKKLTKDKADLVISMASQARSGQKGGVGRQAFASMTGYSIKESNHDQKYGRLSFKDMAQVAKKASTLNKAVDAFRSAGFNKQNAFHKVAGKARLGPRASDLSVSKISVEDGVETGALSNADLDLFRNIKDLKD